MVEVRIVEVSQQAVEDGTAIPACSTMAERWGEHKRLGSDVKAQQQCQHFVLPLSWKRLDIVEHGAHGEAGVQLSDTER